MLTDIQLTHASFDLWLMGDSETNRADLDCAKKYLPIILDECVTVKQKTYIMEYFVEQRSIAEIAKRHQVNRSTVSRTIDRGLDIAYRYLRFVSPLFINLPRKRDYLRRGRGKSL